MISEDKRWGVTNIIQLLQMEKKPGTYKGGLMYVSQNKSVFMSIAENITKLNWFLEASELELLFSSSIKSNGI